MTEFTPVSALVGGFLLGAAALSLLFFNGRVTGISGIFGGFLGFKRGDTLWRSVFIAGLLVGGAMLTAFYPDALQFEMKHSASTVMLAGLLVGIGSRMGSGCTSGHGICGIGRVSPRSLVAVATFMATGIAAAVAVDLIFGGRI